MIYQDAFAQALLDPAQPCPAGLITWNGSDPAKRFAIYRNNVVVSLIDALVSTFPVTRALVGEEFFYDMARRFALASPPSTPVLAHYGEALPAFIEQFPPAASIAYLADVARLERLRVHAYHAAETQSLSSAMISATLIQAADKLPDWQVGCHPSAAVLQSRYAVVSLWEAHQGIREIATVDPCLPESALIIRVGFDVRLAQLNTGTAAFIEQLLRNANLGTAVEHAYQTAEDFDLPQALALLMRFNAIVSLQPPE